MIAFAPSRLFVGVPSRSRIAWSTSASEAKERPRSASASSPLTLPTAVSTPEPPYRWGSPSRSSTASRVPVEAPDGTPARAWVPSARVTVTASVGRLRESRISRADRSVTVNALTGGLRRWLGCSARNGSERRVRRRAPKGLRGDFRGGDSAHDQHRAGGVPAHLLRRRSQEPAPDGGVAAVPEQDHLRGVLGRGPQDLLGRMPDPGRGRDLNPALGRQRAGLGQHPVRLLLLAPAFHVHLAHRRGVVRQVRLDGQHGDRGAVLGRQLQPELQGPAAAGGPVEGDQRAGEHGAIVVRTATAGESIGLREAEAGRLDIAGSGGESGTIWGSYAAAAWRSGVLVNAGCHRWKSSASWSLRTRTRTCNRRCAPRGVQRICCFLTMRLLTSWLTADSTNEVEMVSPAR